jgi:hypothetical protein
MFDTLLLNTTKKNYFFFNLNFLFKIFFFKSVFSLTYGSFYNFFIFYFLFNFLFGVFPFSYKVNLKTFDSANLDSGRFKIIFFYNTFFNNPVFIFLKQSFNFTFLSNFRSERILSDFPINYNFSLSKSFFYINFFNIWDLFYLRGLDNIKNYFIPKSAILDFCLTLNKNYSININETT